MTERHYRPLRGARGEYVVFEDDSGWRWTWQEPNEADDVGPAYASRAEALDGIADNWEETGGEHLPRFVGMMRGLAKRERNALDQLLGASGPGMPVGEGEK